MTAGFQSPSLDNPNGNNFPYTRVLEQLIWSDLRQRNITNIGVVVENEGINGDRIGGMILRFNPRVTRHKPDYVIIWGGYNDLHPNIEIQKIALDLKKLYDMTRQIGAEPIACSLTPSRRQSTPSRIIELNKQIETICLKEKILYVNLYNALIDAEGKLDSKYTNWGGHLNNLGYTRVAETIFDKAIKKIISDME